MRPAEQSEIICVLAVEGRWNDRLRPRVEAEPLDGMEELSSQAEPGFEGYPVDDEKPAVFQIPAQGVLNG